MENGTIRIEVVGQDGKVRRYLVDTDTLISLKDRGIEYRIVLEG